MTGRDKPKYYLVEAGVLPEVFTKVTEARELLETGEVRTVADAVERQAHDIEPAPEIRHRTRGKNFDMFHDLILFFVRQPLRRGAFRIRRSEGPSSRRHRA